MPTWSATPVNQVPTIKLTNWRVVEVSDGKSVARVFVGYNITEGEGRVSSKIESFADGIGITASGRRYELVRHPGLNMDASYTFNQWCSMYGVTDEMITDVSDQYAPAGELQERNLLPP